jgi:hypothetical protein
VSYCWQVQQQQLFVCSHSAHSCTSTLVFKACPRLWLSCGCRPVLVWK